MEHRKLGRNAPCWCGSGRKYKKCHLAAEEKAEVERNRPRVPHAREYWELLRSTLGPAQIRSDEVRPGRR